MRGSSLRSGQLDQRVPVQRYSPTMAEPFIAGVQYDDLKGEVALDVSHPAIAPAEEVPAGIPVEHEEGGEDTPAA